MADLVQRLTKAHKEIHEDSNSILGTINAYQSLHPELAEEYMKRMSALESEIRHIEKKWEGKKTYRSEQFLHIMIPYLLANIARTQSIIDLNTIGREFSSKEVFEHYMIIEGIRAEEISDVVDSYHQAVKHLLEFQGKHRKAISIEPVNVEDVSEYKRLCESYTLRLDEAASRKFGRKITTPANFDVKETNPHQFLGRINVGFEQTLLNLISTIGHEGPFGHNTHMMLSKETDYHQVFRHETEGLAVLGEGLALTSQGVNDELIELQMTKRKMNDSLYAAIEMLAFHDMLTVDQIAERLSNEFVTKKRLVTGLSHLEKDRTYNVTFASMPYYVGAKIAIKAYTDASEFIRSISHNEEDYDRLHQGLVLKMFMGHKPARLMAQDLHMYLGYVKKSRESSGSANGAGSGAPLQYRLGP